MDETGKQLTIERRSSITANSNHVDQFNTEYEPKDLTILFMFFNSVKGKCRVDVSDSRTAQTWGP